MPPFLIPGIIVLLALSLAFCGGIVASNLLSAVLMAAAGILGGLAVYVSEGEGYQEGRKDEADEMEDAL